jgi:hypothetical protein
VTELPVTWGRAARVYWAFFWRGVVFLIVPLAVVGFFFGIALAGNGIAPEKHLWKLQTVLFPLSVLVAIWIMKDILASPMGKFRIVLVSTESSAQPSLPPDVPSAPSALQGRG